MNALKYHSVVQENGTIKLPVVPLPEGSKVEVIILPEEESLEMMQAAESSLKFWDNPVDDAIWNNA
jgi:predicted DNA-binding antitoxin AbrB/MazE fold protein